MTSPLEFMQRLAAVLECLPGFGLLVGHPGRPAAFRRPSRGIERA